MPREILWHGHSPQLSIGRTLSEVLDAIKRPGVTLQALPCGQGVSFLNIRGCERRRDPLAVNGPAGTLTVRDVLGLDGVKEWVLEVVPNGGLGRSVRWVQCLDPGSQELASSGDLVISASRAEPSGRSILTEQIDGLSKRGVAGFGFRLLEPLADESIQGLGRVNRMPLIALNAHAPLHPLAETMNRAIAEAETLELRSLDEVTSALHESLAGGLGLHGLIKTAADLVEAPVALLTPVGRIVSVEGHDATNDLQPLLTADETRTADVNIQGRLWGTLIIGGVSPTQEPRRRGLLQRLPGAIAIELMRSAERMAPEERARRELVIDLLVGAIRSESEFILRAASTDFYPRSGNALVGMAMPLVQGIRSSSVRTLVSLDIQSLDAELDTDLLFLLSLPPAVDRMEVAVRIIERLPQDLRSTAAVSKPMAAIGPVVGVTEAGRSLQEARDTLSLAREAGSQLPIVTTEQFAVERLLARLLEGPELARFADALLKPLIEYDATNNGRLVHTLETYFAKRMSKTDAAKALHLRRQSLYGRLDHIIELIGPLDDPESCLALQIALKANRLTVTHGRQSTIEDLWSARTQIR